MVTGFVLHLLVYSAVCAFLVGVWALGGGGSIDELRGYLDDPASIEASSFWPVWVIMSWGTAVVIHLGFAVVITLRRGARRNRRHLARLARDAKRKHATPPTAVHRSGEPVGSGHGRVPAERRWVTVMVTDIVNSTRLTEVLGDDEWTRLLRQHRAMVRQALVARNGEEVSTQGDGFLARFGNPAEAVLCAVDIQQAMSERREGAGIVPSIRIGIHAGEAVEDDGDLVGRVVNLAARVAGEAGADEILVTEPVADYLGTRLSFEDRGIRELKGFAQPRHLLSVVWEPADDDLEESVVEG